MILKVLVSGPILDEYASRLEKVQDKLEAVIIKEKFIANILGCTPGSLGERLNGIQEVSGSIPLISTTKSTENTTFSVLFRFSKLLQKRAGQQIGQQIC